MSRFLLIVYIQLMPGLMSPLPNSFYQSVMNITLWLAALQETRIQTDFADVVTVQHPTEKTLQAQTVSTVGACSKSPL